MMFNLMINLKKMDGCLIFVFMLHSEGALWDFFVQRGGAESLLTLTNLFIVLGLREGLRKAENSQRDQNASTPNSGLDE